MQNTQNRIAVFSSLVAVMFASMLVVDKAQAQSTLDAQRTRPATGAISQREIPNPSLGVQPVVYRDSFVDHVIDDDIYLFVIYGNTVTKIDKRNMEILGSTELPMRTTRLNTRPPLPGAPDPPVRRDGDGLEDE